MHCVIKAVLKQELHSDTQSNKKANFCKKLNMFYSLSLQILHLLLFSINRSIRLARLLLKCLLCLLRCGEDREGADRQSWRDCLPRDAHGQEDGRPLCGCVQRRRQTLHARGHGTTPG